MDNHVEEAVAAIIDKLPVKPGLGIILGSGLGPLADEIENPFHLDFAQIPHFPVSSVSGHKARLVCGSLAGVPLVAMAGRVHYYEGYPMDRITFPVRVLAGLGIKMLIVTNAAGAVNTAYTPGDIILLNDHINLSGINPLRGSSNFIDMGNAYDRDLRATAQTAARDLGITLKSGTYMWFSGPSYETPAEIRAVRTLGADLVGMSTVPEVVMANNLGLRVLGLSMVTNMAAGITGQPLTHSEVLETTEKAKHTFTRLVREVIKQLA